MKRIGKVVLGFCVLSAVVIGTYVHAQRRGPGGFAAMRMLPLEQEWAQICFELDTTDEQVAALRKIYKAAWDERAELLDEARASEFAAEDIAESFRQIRTELDGKIKQILKEKQRKKFAEIQERTRARWERFRRGRIR